MLRGGMRGGRTDTGATLYEIVNPCRCPVVNGKHVWSETCGQRAKPPACPACGCGDVREAHRIFSCGECEWMQRAACGVAERIESWDVTSLYVYPTCLMGDLPVPNATWLTSSEIAALDPETFLFDEEGERHFWVVTCDMEANPTCFYPIVSMKRDVGGTQKLVFDNSNLRGECTCGASPPCFIPHGPSCTTPGCDKRCHGTCS